MPRVKVTFNRLVGYCIFILSFLVGDPMGEARDDAMGSWGRMLGDMLGAA